MFGLGLMPFRQVWLYKVSLTGTVWVEQHVNASVFLLETDSFAIFESAIEGEYSWIESSIQDHTGTSGPNLCAQLFG